MARWLDVAARLGGWPRRIAALCCLLLAAGTAVAARSAPARSDPGPTRPVVVAARDLAAGTVLRATDVRVARWPSGLAPPGALRAANDAVGHRLGGAVGAREPVTRARLVGSGLTTGLPAGLVATTVPLSSAGAGLVQAGDIVDLLAPPATSDAGSVANPARAAPDAARVVAERVRVLAVLHDTTGAGAAEQADLAVAVDRDTAVRLAGLAGRPLLAVVRNPP